MELARELQGFLLREWSSGLRLTTIPQAMERLGIDENPNVRWHVGRSLESLWRSTLTDAEKRRQMAEALGRDLDDAWSEEWRQQVQTWNPATVLLTESEKLVARAMLMHRRNGLGLSQSGDIARILGLGVRQVHQAIRMLARIEFLSLEDGRRPDSYTLADGHERLLEGLGFSFHTVTLDTGERFGVPWALDFLLLVSSQYRKHHLTLDDACAHCVDRIRVTVDRGALREVYPEKSIVYRGGTWGQNNLFRSEEHLREWYGGPAPEARRWSTVRRFLAQEQESTTMP